MKSRAMMLAMIALAACERPTQPDVASRLTVSGPSLDNTTVKDNETFDLVGDLVSPCNGEHVTFQGTAHVVSTFTPTDNGFTVSTHFNTQELSGVSDDGTKYQLSEISNEDATVASDGTGSASVHSQFRVISNDSTDNFLFDAIYTFTFPPPTATYKFDNARCQG